MESKTQSQIFQTFLNAIPSWKASLQVRATSKVKNPQCFLHITAEVGYDKKRQINEFLLEFEIDDNKKYEI